MDQKARVQCACAVFGAGISRQCDRRQSSASRNAQRANPPEQLVAVNLRHADVAEENVRSFLFDERQRLARRARSEHFRIAIGEHALHQIACIVFIVHDQHFDAGQIQGLEIN